MLVAQAVLVWTPYAAEELQDFIETGYLHNKKPANSIPYNPATLERMQRLEDERAVCGS